MIKMRELSVLCTLVVLIPCAISRKGQEASFRRDLYDCVDSIITLGQEPVPEQPHQDIAKICTAFANYYAISRVSSEPITSWHSYTRSPEEMALTCTTEEDERLFWYMWEQANEQCVASARLVKEEHANDRDYAYIHSIELIDVGPPLTVPDRSETPNFRHSWLKIGPKLKLVLVISVLTLFSLFQLYSWCGSISQSGDSNANNNTKDITWVCVSHK